MDVDEDDTNLSRISSSMTATTTTTVVTNSRNGDGKGNGGNGGCVDNGGKNNEESNTSSSSNVLSASAIPVPPNSMEMDTQQTRAEANRTLETAREKFCKRHTQLTFIFSSEQDSHFKRFILLRNQSY